MKTSLLICATCLIVTGCSAQLRFPSLSSALSSLTGFGGSSSSSSSSNGQSGQSSSPYSGLVRDYGRNLMMAMSSIYPTLFKPPQSQQQQPQQQPQSQIAPQSPYDQAFGASQYGSQNLFPSQSAPSFSFGGSTFSISPSLPFGSMTGSGSQPQPSGGSQSPFSGSFGSSINSPSSFGPLSSSPFLQQSMPSYAPASSYNDAFQAANGGPSMNSPSFGNFNSASGVHSSNPALSSQGMASQPSNSNPINSYPSMSSFNGQHDSSALGSQTNQQAQGPIGQQSAPQPSFGSHPSNSQYGPQQYRPDIMSLAASGPVPSSNSYSSYGSSQSQQSQPQQQQPSNTYQQQPSYR